MYARSKVDHGLYIRTWCRKISNVMFNFSNQFTSVQLPAFCNWDTEILIFPIVSYPRTDNIILVYVFAFCELTLSGVSPPSHDTILMPTLSQDNLSYKTMGLSAGFSECVKCEVRWTRIWSSRLNLTYRFNLQNELWLSRTTRVDIFS